MAKMKYITVKSGLATLNGKYTGQFLSNGTIDLEEIAEKICKDRPAVDEPELKLCARALAAEVKKEVAENLNYVTTGTLCAFAPAISGSVPAMDSALTSENGFYVNITPLLQIASRIGAIVPTKDKAKAAEVTLDNVEDKATKKRGIVVGTHEFIVTGYNLSATAEGESIKLVDKAGEVHAGRITGRDGCGQRIDVMLTSDPLDGDGEVVLTSRGYATPERDPDIYTKKVLVVAAPPPPGPVLNSLTNLQGQHFTNTDTDGYLKGANFTGATVRAEYGTRLDPSSEELDWSYFSDSEFSYEVEDATKIRIHQPAGYEVSAYAYRYTVATINGEVVETFE